MADTRDIQVLRVEDIETGEKFSVGAPWFVDAGAEGIQDAVVDGVDASHASDESSEGGQSAVVDGVGASRASIFAVGSIVKLDPAIARQTLKKTQLGHPVLVDVPRLALPGSPLSKLTKASRLKVTGIVDIQSVGVKHKITLEQPAKSS